MGKFIFKRLGQMLFTLYIVITATFFLMHAIPGGPFTREKPLPPAVIAALEAKFNLNAPLHVQYFDYMKGVFSFDFGPSFQKVGVEVIDLVKVGLPISARVGGTAVLVVLIIGIPLGIISAMKQNKWEDYVVTVIATLGVTIPSFVIATMIIYIFSGKLGILPAFGLTSWKHYIGPVIALSGFSLAFVSKLTRSSMLEVLQQDYIRTARAKGLSEFVVIGKHALKNALLPVVTYVGPMVAGILTGSFVIEKIFAIPGMGKYFVESVGNRDYTVIMGVTIFYAGFYIIMVFLVDIIYVLIDPRIKLHD
jgi:oligopeptide transport system permease protein